MKTVGNAIYQALCTAAVSAVQAAPPAQTAQYAKTAFSHFKNDLKMAGEKFLPRPGGTSALLRSSPSPLRGGAIGPRQFSNHALRHMTKAPFAKLAEMYEGQCGRLRDYDKAHVTDSAEAVSWAADQGLLPKDARSIVDIGAAQGGAVVKLGNRYPQAAILALDPDPQSAAFITNKIKNSEGDAALEHPERVGTFTGTMLDAMAQGACKENSVSLVNMQAVAPYLPDEQLAHTLKAIHSALEPGGQVVLSCYGEEHYRQDAGGKKNLHLRTDLEMHDMLAEAGFTVKCMGNVLANERVRYDKTSHEMHDVLAQNSVPPHPEGNYWHTINIVAVKA